MATNNYNLEQYKYTIPTYENRDDLEQYKYSLPEFTSEWKDKSNTLADTAINTTYDNWLTSSDYQKLKDRYSYLGKKSMQDTLGQVSARTGGLASSYAGSVAQQSYNDYMTRLEEVARSMYGQARNEAFENAQLAGSMYDRDYNQYASNVGLNLQTLGHNADLANSMYNRWIQGENLKLSGLGHNADIDNGIYGRSMDEYNNALDKANMTGVFTGLAAYGWSAEEIAAARAQWLLANTVSSGSGGSGRSSGGSGGSGGSSNRDKIKKETPTTPTTVASPSWQLISDVNKHNSTFNTGAAKTGALGVDKSAAYGVDLDPKNKNKYTKVIGMTK